MNVRTSGLRGLALVALGTLTFAACDDKEPTAPIIPPAVVVTVTPQTATLTVGQTLPVGVSVANATQNSTVTWLTSNAAVAEVSATGVITARGPGSALITARSNQDTTAKGFVSVTVNAAARPSITVQPTSATINTGGTLPLVAQVTGSTNTAVTWRSADTTIVRVSSTGVVTGVRAGGPIVVTAISQADTTARATSLISVSAQTSNVQLVLTPTSATIRQNDSIPFDAVVTGATNTTVTWRSNNPAVAVVSPTGLVRGVSPGQAVITAIANADTTVRRQATVIVTAPAPAPSISIASVNTAAGAPVNPAAIAGQINVTVNVSAVPENDVRAVVVRVDDVEVCRQNFTQPLGTTQGVATINCPINTAATDSLGNGLPLFPNGPHTISAAALNGEGTEITRADFCPLGQAAPGQRCTVTFANVDVAVATVTFDNGANPTSAIGVDGFLWNSGSVTVTVRPAIFSGATIGQLGVGIDINCDGNIETARLTTAGANNTWSATFPKSGTGSAVGANGGVANISDNNVCARVTAATSTNGQPIAITTLVPGVGASAIFRLDNLAPSAPTVAFPAGVSIVPCTTNLAVQCAYLGSNFVFSFASPTSTAAQIAAATATNVQDQMCATGDCANIVTVTFHVGPASTPNTAAGNASIAATPAITNVQQLTSTLRSDTLSVVAVARDILGNSTTVRLAMDFGVDLTAPTIAVAAGSVSAASINQNAGVYLINLTDDVSGPASVQFRMVRWTNAASGADQGACVTDAAATTFGANATNRTLADCAWQNLPASALAAPNQLTSQAAVPIPDAEGWYQIEIRTVDVAGNVSSTLVSRDALVDVTAPSATVSSVTATTNSVTLVGTVNDNLDLDYWDVRLQFAGFAGATSLPEVLPVTGSFDVGAYGLPLTETAAANGTSPLVRGIQNGVGGAIFNLSQVGIGVVDVAQNFNLGTFLTVTATSNGVPATVTAFSLSASPTIVCRTGTTAACLAANVGNTSTTLSAVVTVGPTDLNPLTQVLFYTVDPNTGIPHLLGASASASVQTGATARTFTFNLTVQASQFLAVNATTTVFALGVDAEADAILGGPITVDVR